MASSSIPQGHEVKERLPVDELSRDAPLVVTYDGDVVLDKEAGVYPKDLQGAAPEVVDPTPDDLVSLEASYGEREAFLATLAEQRRYAELQRIVGILASAGFVTQAQQANALERPEFSGLDPESPDELIRERAELVLSNQRAEDLAVRDPRTGS